MAVCTGRDCEVCKKVMGYKISGQVEIRERIRKARNELEPLVSGTGKQFGREMNDLLNKLTDLEARCTTSAIHTPTKTAQ